MRTSLVKLEKEAQLVLNEILAKLNQNEKLIGVGAIVAVVGWLFGMLITDHWYDASGAQGLGILAVVAAVAAVVVLYLKVAPTSNVAWPVPVSLILLIIAAVVGVIALIGLFQALTYDPFAGYGNLLGVKAPSKPITLYVAVLAVAVGGGLMAYASYMEWVAAGKPTK